MARKSYFHAKFRKFCSESRKSGSNATCFDLEKLTANGVPIWRR